MPCSSSSTATSGAQVSVEDCGIAAHGVRLAARDLAPPVQHDDLGAEIHHKAHVVLHDQEGRPPRVQRTEAVGDSFEQGRVDAACWFVEEHQLRLRHHHYAELEELALSV